MSTLLDYIRKAILILEHKPENIIEATNEEGERIVLEILDDDGFYPSSDR